MNPDDLDMQDCAIRHRDTIKLLEYYHIYKNNRVDLDSKDYYDFRLVDSVLARMTIKQDSAEVNNINKIKNDMERRYL